MNYAMIFDLNGYHARWTVDLVEFILICMLTRACVYVCVCKSMRM